MTHIHCVHVDTDVTCLLTGDGRFVGAVKCSRYPDQPWAFAVDPDGLIVMNAEASEETGEYLNDLYRKCERVLLDTFTKRSEQSQSATDIPADGPEVGEAVLTE